MKLDPFIEAEKIAVHSVAKTCGLFEVGLVLVHRRKGAGP
jgi:hypothetical protein